MTMVLVVEDEATLALLATITLEDEGYEVAVAANGRKGIETARERRPAVIVTDYMMPAVDGIEMMRTLREDGLETPIILVSAVSERRIPGREEGLYQAYLTKPYHERDLVRLVGHLLDGGAPPTT